MTQVLSKVKMVYSFHKHCKIFPSASTDDTSLHQNLSTTPSSINTYQVYCKSVSLHIFLNIKITQNKRSLHKMICYYSILTGEVAYLYCNHVCRKRIKSGLCK